LRAEDARDPFSGALERSATPVGTAAAAEPYLLAVDLEDQVLGLSADERDPGADDAPKPGATDQRRVGGELFTDGPSARSSDEAPRLVGEDDGIHGGVASHRRELVVERSDGVLAPSTAALTKALGTGCVHTVSGHGFAVDILAKLEGRGQVQRRSDADALR
jgi:hypothetical protein